MNEPLRILPLGDSITYGDGGSNAGYRAELAALLAGAGHAFCFVGTSRDNPGTLRGDQVWHEGHPGWLIRGDRSGRDGLADHVPRWQRRKLAPDVILLMIGTNDVAMGHEPGGAAARLDELVDMLIDEDGLAPHGRLLLAQITPILDAEADARARAFNARVAELVARRAAAGENVQLVDMHGALSPTDMADALHPNDAGYRKIARAWFDALTGRLGYSARR